LKIDYDDIEALPYDSLFEHLDTPHISDKIDRSNIDRSKNPENPGGDRGESILNDLDDPVDDHDELGAAIDEHFNDDAQGAPIQPVLDSTSITESQLNDLVNDGDLYEPRSGFIAKL